MVEFHFCCELDLPYLALNCIYIFSLLICYHFLRNSCIYFIKYFTYIFSFKTPNNPIEGVLLLQYYRWSLVKLSDFPEVTQACLTLSPLWILAGVWTAEMWCFCVHVTDSCLVGKHCEFFPHDKGDCCSTNIPWINESSVSHHTLVEISNVSLC